VGWGVHLKNRQKIVDFVLERILQARQWKHVQERDLKDWLVSECELRRFDPSVTKEVIDDLLRKEEENETHGSDSER
jgi:hypothetical protein